MSHALQLSPSDARSARIGEIDVAADVTSGRSHRAPAPRPSVIDPQAAAALAAQGLPDLRIARELGCSAPTVRRHLNALGVPARRRGLKGVNPRSVTAEECAEAYENDKLSCEEAGRKLGVSGVTVLRRLRAANVETRSPAPTPLPITVEEVLLAVKAAGGDRREAAARLSTSVYVVDARLNEAESFGINVAGLRPAPAFRSDITPAMTLALFAVENNKAEIARVLKCSVDVVGRRLRRAREEGLTLVLKRGAIEVCSTPGASLEVVHSLPIPDDIGPELRRPLLAHFTPEVVDNVARRSPENVRYLQAGARRDRVDSPWRQREQWEPDGSFIHADVLALSAVMSIHEIGLGLGLTPVLVRDMLGRTTAYGMTALVDGTCIDVIHNGNVIAERDCAQALRTIRDASVRTRVNVPNRQASRRPAGKSSADPPSRGVTGSALREGTSATSARKSPRRHSRPTTAATMKGNVLNPAQLKPQSTATSMKATAAGVANLGKGGICNYRADREWRQYRQALWPEFETYDVAPAHSSVEVVEAALDAGITRFLDLGAGFPDDTCLAKIARRRFPAARVTAVDNDVTVARTWAAALTSKHTSCDATSFFQGDLAEPAAVLGHARAHRTLDPREPVCIVLTDVLHHLGDHLPLREIIGAYQEAVPAGSLLAISHLTTDGASARQLEQINELAAAYGDIGEPLRPRTHTEVTALFGTWALCDPGVVSQRPAETPPGELGAIRWAGVAVKPA